MRRKTTVILIVILFIFPLLSLSANTNDDWPMFRHDPQHTGYTDCEMPDELELLWKFETTGPITWPSSPAIVEGKIYVTSVTYIYCLSGDTGDLVWSYKTDGWVDSSPAVVYGKVYVGSCDDYIYCLDADTGDLIWRYKTGISIDSSPAVVYGKVYVGSRHDYIYCLDADTGDLIWRYKTGDPVVSSPAVVDSKVYVGSDDNYLYCFDAKKEKLRWKYKTGFNVYSSPLVANDKIYVGSHDHYIYCLDTDTGKLIWKYKSDGIIASSPAVAYDRLYIGSSDNYIYCLNTNTGKLAWKYKTGGDIWSSPAVADGKVYVGSCDHYIYCLNADRGGLIWKYKTGGSIESSPAVANGKVYVGSHDGYLYCFGAKKETPPPTTPPSSFETIFIGCPLSEEWPTPPYECLKDLWWQDSNENGVLDLSESREEVYIDEDSEKFEYRTVIEEEPKGITWYGGEDNETPYFLITNPATVKFLGNFYNIIYCNEGEGYFVCATPHWSWDESTSEDIVYFEVGKTISFYGWEITLMDTNIYENKIKWHIRSPKDESSEYIVVLSRSSNKGHNVIAFKEWFGDQKFTIFALDSVKLLVGAGGVNQVGATIYALTDIELINVTDIAKKIENYNLEIPISLDSGYTLTIEKKDIEFNPDGKEEYVISLTSEKIKPVLPTPAPTTTPPTTTTPASTTPAPTTTPAPITPTPTTIAPTTSSPTTLPTTTPPQQSNSFLYIGLFVAVIVLSLAVYKITKKEPEKSKKKLSPEQTEQIKQQIEEKKKYIENYRKIMEQDPTKKEMAEKLIKRYEEEIEELERKVRE